MNDTSTVAAERARPLNPLLSARILPTLMRLSFPNLFAMLATAIVAVAETSYIGLLGTGPLAAMALVFPMIMLSQMLSSGAMGGGVSSAISRAIGSGDMHRATVLALHAAIIGACIGLTFTAIFLSFGPVIYRLLGGRGEVLAQAILYSNVVFSGAISIWLVNTLASVIRGTGNMIIPSATSLCIALMQIAIGGSLGLGLGPFPHFGMPGVAVGQVAAFSAGALFLLWFLLSGRSRLRLTLRGFRPQRAMFADILRVGAIACLSPLQSIATMLVFTGLVARFGTEALAGYGIGARLEFLLIPIAFAVGVACVPMVGMAIGAGDIPRARRVAWTGGALAAIGLGSLGIVVAIIPDVWARLFTSDPAVLKVTHDYLGWAGPGFGFFGLAMCLYFSSQGAGKMIGPVLAQGVRFGLVAGVGSLLVASGAPLWTLFALVCGAMVAYGSTTALAVYLTRWERR